MAASSPCLICLREPCDRPLALPCGHVACMECWLEFWNPDKYRVAVKPVVFHSRGCCSVASCPSEKPLARIKWSTEDTHCVFSWCPKLYVNNGADMWSLSRDLIHPEATLSFRAELESELVKARAGDRDAMLQVAKWYRSERGTPYDGRRAYYWVARAFRKRHPDARDVLMKWIQAGCVHWKGYEQGKAMPFWIEAGERWPPRWPAPVFPGMLCRTHGVCQSVCPCLDFDEDAL